LNKIVKCSIDKTVNLLLTSKYARVLGGYFSDFLVGHFVNWAFWDLWKLVKRDEKLKIKKLS